MTELAPEIEDDETGDGLFITDAELIKRLNVPKKIGYRAIQDLEKHVPGRPKFPGYDPLFPRRRFWPAVKRYFMLRHGLADQPFIAAPHWQETKHATDQAGKTGRDRDVGPRLAASREVLDGLLDSATRHRRPRLSHKKPTLVAAVGSDDSDPNRR